MGFRFNDLFHLTENEVFYFTISTKTVKLN